MRVQLEEVSFEGLVHLLADLNDLSEFLRGCNTVLPLLLFCRRYICMIASGLARGATEQGFLNSLVSAVFLLSPIVPFCSGPKKNPRLRHQS